MSLDIGSAISAGQELRPLQTKFAYGPKSLTLEHLAIGRPDNVTLEGFGSFDRAVIPISGSSAFWASVRSVRHQVSSLPAWVSAFTAGLGGRSRSTASSATAERQV